MLRCTCEMAAKAVIMKAEIVNPFIESVNELFATMLNCPAERQQIGVVRGSPAAHEVTAVIGLSGTAKGTVALSFPQRTASVIVGRLLGSGPVESGEALTDGVAELVNMVAGGAKAKLSANRGTAIDLSLPTVVLGKNVQLQSPSQADWLDIPFESELGPFTVRVTFAA
jgi:chemotaxis protein CheX